MNQIILNWIPVICIGGLLVMVAGIFGAYFFFTARSEAKSEARVRTYTPAHAVIARVEDAGMFLNNEPMANVTLLVTPTDRPFFLAMLSRAFSPFDLRSLVAGGAAQVRFDPNNTGKVVIESLGDSGTVVSEENKQLASMLGQLESYTQLRKSGVEAKGNIRTFTNLNIRVDDASWVFHIKFDVTTAAGENFQAETVMAIDDDSIHKLQPGREMIVKYDPSNKTRAILIHAIGS